MDMKKYYEEPDFKEIIFRVNDVIMASGNNASEPWDLTDDDKDWSGDFNGMPGQG